MAMNFSIYRIPSSQFDWFKNASDEAVQKKIEGLNLPGDRIFKTETMHEELRYVLTGTESAGRSLRSLIFKHQPSYKPGGLLSPRSVQELQVEIARYLTPDVVAARIRSFEKEERRDIKKAFKEFCAFVFEAVDAGDALLTIWSDTASV